MAHRLLIPLEGRLVILPAVNQPQPLLEDWPWAKAIVWLHNTSTANKMYIGGPPDAALPQGAGQTTGPVAASASLKGFPIPEDEGFRMPGPISELWIAGTEGDVLLFCLFPP